MIFTNKTFSKFLTLSILFGGLSEMWSATAFEVAQASTPTISKASPSIPQYNMLVVDSSFAPIAAKDISIGRNSCFWLHENPSMNLPTQGECYDSELWNSWGADETLDTLKAKKSYLLSVHGSRSAYLASQASQGKAQILFLRNMSSQVGEAKQKEQAWTSAEDLPRYKNSCTLVNWSPAREASLRSTSLLEYQNRIASLLTANPSIRVINMSLGYKESWIADDSQNCTPEQVKREFNLLQATWSRLFKMFPERLFVVAAGNESENFDRVDFLSSDLWASLVDNANLLLVGAMISDGRRLASSNYGLVVEAFALGNEVSMRSPFPKKDLGLEDKVSGTSYAAPIVAGQILALLLQTPNSSVLDLKTKIVSRLRETRKGLLMDSFGKYCKGKKHLEECLDVVSDLISRPLLWRPTYEFYLEGRNAWEYQPMALQFQEDLPALGQTKLLFIQNNLVPALLLKPTDNPWELLITLHHEIYHFSKMKESAKLFAISDKIKNCVTPYQLALLADELPAYREELEFFKSSPPWFKRKLGNQKLKSLLFGGSLSYHDFYKKLEDRLQKNPKFIYEKYVELGHYPKCILELLPKS